MSNKGKKWISIDPAKGLSGVAWWIGDKLERTFIVKKRGNKGAYYFGDEICDSMSDAWGYTVSWAGNSTAIVEKGAGGLSNVVNAQGWMRGYLERSCELVGANTVVLGVSEWRRVIREAHDVSWPSGRDAKKRLSVQLVRSIYGIDVSDDESDAVLLGAAALRMGYLN